MGLDQHSGHAAPLGSRATAPAVARMCQALCAAGADGRHDDQGRSDALDTINAAIGRNRLWEPAVNQMRDRLHACAQRRKPAGWQIIVPKQREREMKKLEYCVTFTTPAFLGNADQLAQWRTPPFKALLRQWWRVVSAKPHRYDHSSLREAEGNLFGNAWLTDDRGRPKFRRSHVGLRLDHWNVGGLASQAWPGGPMESVLTTADGKGSVRADVYLGFGPVLPPSKKEGRSSITIRGAIAPGKAAVFSLMCADSQDLVDSLQLMAWFGTLGSRARNGWGSLSLSALKTAPDVTPLPTADHRLMSAISREWRDCFDRDWSHAVGTVSGAPLIWLTKPYQNWREVMGALANIRVAVRRVAKVFVGPDHIGGIHLLGYPAGGQWELSAFKKGRPSRDDEEARLATQLRFKVCAVPDGFVGVVFHLPHRFPDALHGRLSAAQQRWLTANQEQVWAKIHDELSQMSRLAPLGGAK